MFTDCLSYLSYIVPLLSGQPLLRTFTLIVSAHPTAHANSHATPCMSARTLSNKMNK